MTDIDVSDDGTAVSGSNRVLPFAIGSLVYLAAAASSSHMGVGRRQVRSRCGWRPARLPGTPWPTQVRSVPSCLLVG